jgi:hypothetical protein
MHFYLHQQYKNYIFQLDHKQFGAWTHVKARWFIFSYKATTVKICTICYSFFSYFSLQWIDAFDFCCGIGMNLLSLELDFKQGNVFAAKACK